MLFSAYTNAELKPGIDIIIDELNIEEDIVNADFVITGEGRLDAQSVMGKAPIGIAKLAKKYNKKVIAFVGCASEDANVCNDYGIDAFFPILRRISTTDEALDIKNATKNLHDTAYQVFRLIKSGE